MRLFETATSMICYGALGFALTAAGLILSGPKTAIGTAQTDLPGEMALAQANSGAAALRDWPPVFGVAPATQTPVTQARFDEAAPDYLVHGVVVNEAMQWALLSLEGVQVVVRAGDTLPGGERVQAIGGNGIELIRGDQSFLLATGRSEPVPEQTPESAPSGAPAVATHMARASTAPSAQDVEQVSVDVGRLDRRALERTFARAGKIKVVAEGEVMGLDVTWVRHGQLFDQIGLEVGDRIITINGQKAVDQNGFSQAYNQAVTSGRLSLEVVREGSIRTISIDLART